MDIQVVQGSDVADLNAALAGTPAQFVALHANVDVRLEGLAPGGAALHGATSCLGAMTQDGPTSGFAAFVMRDPNGAYGTALRGFNGQVRTASAEATQQALIHADRAGEVPDLVWISTTPGCEEDVLAGVEDIVGPGTPIIGGSAADNDVSGEWCVFDGAQKITDGVVVSVLFPSRPVSFAYQNGYAPTQNAGVVTKTAGRSILEIDDRPAGQVYAEWTGGAVASGDVTGAPKAILSDSTLWPLGRRLADVGDVPFYLLAHPAVAHETGALDLFATVTEGEQITCMTGTKRSLIDRAGRVAALAKTTRQQSREPIAGALMIYCGGCRLAVNDALDQVVAGVNSALGDAPFLGAFTFGEQGPLVGSGNRHGNLMISCVVFG